MITAGHTGHAAIQGKLPYDLLRDFAPVTEMVTTFYLLFAHPSVGVQSVQELVALARSTHVRANKLRALAVSSSTRSRALPDLPTVVSRACRATR